MTRSPEDPPRLLLTRPRAGSERFAQQFRARFGADWPITIAPLLEIVPTGAAVPDAGTIVFTSEQAVALVAAARAPAGRTAYCVGPRTAAAALAAGFEVIAGPADARALVAQIIACPPDRPLLHARGAEVAFPVADTLNSAGIETIEVVLYRQEPVPPGAEVRGLLAGAAPLLVPIFSPRSATLFCRAATGARAPLWLAPISTAAAQGCAALHAARQEIARHPDADGVLDALQRLMGAGVPG